MQIDTTYDKEVKQIIIKINCMLHNSAVLLQKKHFKDIVYGR